MKVLVVVLAALLILDGSRASAASANRKVGVDEFFHTKYGYCHSKLPAGYSCTYGVSSPSCKVGLQNKNGSISYFYLTGTMTLIAKQARSAQSKPLVSYKGITCVAKNVHLKAVQKCKTSTLQNGKRQDCKIAIEDKGLTEWYDIGVVITDTTH